MTKLYAGCVKSIPPGTFSGFIQIGLNLTRPSCEFLSASWDVAHGTLIISPPM